MATTVSYNGTNYTVPQPGNSGWGTTLTTYLVALASGSLTKAGGLMTLTAELDLGATYGIKSAYFSARGTPATAGAYRLENNTSISWRNAANDGNLNLTVNSSNALQFNSLPIVALALGAANTVLKMNSGGTAFEYGTLVNANINASAAIAYSKLNLATSIVNADISASAAIAYSKLAALTSANIIVGSASNVATAVAVTGDVTLSNTGVTSIASGVIVNADINSSAAIDGSKIVSASGSVAGVVTTDTQTFAGAKTFSSLAGTGTRMVTADTNGTLAASAIFQDSGEQNATLSWSSTAPSSAVYEKYRWYRIGNLVTLTISANYAVAGATNTSVYFEFPSGMPAPVIPTGANTTEYIHPGFGYWHTADGNLTSASSKVGLYYAAANTFRLFCIRASGSAAFAAFGITYVTTGSDIP